MSTLRRAVIASWEQGTDDLRRGDTGDDVRTLQRLLLLWSFPAGPPDGVWGARTDSAMVDCQRELSLAADGILGPFSRARLSFAHAAGWMRGRYLPICEGGPLAQGRHPVMGDIPARRGKVSTFGGPGDAGDRGYGQALVRIRSRGDNDAAALYEQHPKLITLGLFQGGVEDPLPEVTCCGQRMRAGISWLLRPESYYCAMRWRKHGRPIPESSRVLLVADNGRKCIVSPTDWGPAKWTGRVIDISPGAERALGIDTDDRVLIAWAEDDSPLGPVS